MVIEESKKSPATSLMDDTALGGNRARKRSAIRKASINFWIDALAFLTFMITAVSGMALMRIHPMDSGELSRLNGELIWGLPYSEWIHLHNLIGWIFVALVAIHLTMHWHWIASMIRKRLSLNRSIGHQLKANGP